MGCNPWGRKESDTTEHTHIICIFFFNILFHCKLLQYIEYIRLTLPNSIDQTDFTLLPDTQLNYISQIPLQLGWATGFILGYWTKAEGDRHHFQTCPLKPVLWPSVPLTLLIGWPEGETPLGPSESLQHGRGTSRTERRSTTSSKEQDKAKPLSPPPPPVDCDMSKK